MKYIMNKLQNGAVPKDISPRLLVERPGAIHLLMRYFIKFFICTISKIGVLHFPPMTKVLQNSILIAGKNKF